MTNVATGLQRLVAWTVSGGLIASALVIAGETSAQDVPDSVAVEATTEAAAASSEAEFMAAPPVLEEEPAPTCPCDEPEPEVDPNAWKKAWQLSAGGALNTGNTQSWIVNAGSDFKAEKQSHTITANGSFSFGRANIPGDALGLTTTVKQLLLGARYDYFFTDKDAVWVALGYRWDQIAGLDTQLRAEAGYLRAFIKDDNHYFAGRIGYSFTYENFVAPVAGTTNDDQSIHGLLLALDYENKLNENVTFLTGITTIFNLNELDAPAPAKAFKDVRVHWHAGLLAKLMEKLAVELRFNLLYDRIPAAAQKVDTTTTLSLIYTLL